MVTKSNALAKSITFSWSMLILQEDKRSRLFRSATSGGNLTPAAAARKKSSLGSERPLSAHELLVQSPTTLEVSAISGF